MTDSPVTWSLMEWLTSAVLAVVTAVVSHLHVRINRQDERTDTVERNLRGEIDAAEHRGNEARHKLRDDTQVALGKVEQTAGAAITELKRDLLTEIRMIRARIDQTATKDDLREATRRQS